MISPSDRPGDSATGTGDAPETDRWGRIYNWQVFLAAVVGLAGTVLLVDPGEQSVGVATLSADPFYGLVALFGVLLVWSGADLWRAYADD